MGARGYPAYRPIRRPLDAGLFLAGFYDRISDSTELTDFVNLPTPIWYQIRLNGRTPAIPSQLSRELDLRTGLLTFRYRLSIADDWVDVREQRFFSLAKPSSGLNSRAAGRWSFWPGSTTRAATALSRTIR